MTAMQPDPRSAAARKLLAFHFVFASVCLLMAAYLTATFRGGAFEEVGGIAMVLIPLAASVTAAMWFLLVAVLARASSSGRLLLVAVILALVAIALVVSNAIRGGLIG